MILLCHPCVDQVCGDASVYCPLGSPVPTRVSAGFYTTGNDGDLLNSTRFNQVRSSQSTPGL